MQELVYRSWDAGAGMQGQDVVQGCGVGTWHRAAGSGLQGRAVAPGCAAGAPEPPAVPGAAAGGSRPRAPSARTAPARGEPAFGSEKRVLQAL